jgi:excinuclease ABC subunit A
MIRVADHIIDLGLGAGEQGGRVVFSGTLDALLRETRSLTSKYLRQELAIPIPTTRRRGTGQKIRLLGATEHNLKDIDVTIPLNALTCVTGVSGSGKSTLVHDVLYAAIKRAKGGWDKRLGAFKKIEGTELITDVVLVDQAPIGRTPRSNPVTYLKAFDPIRELFAATKDARSRGLTASHFSFNVPGGRCEACQGEGEVRVEMQFLADVFVPCDQCDGKRFKPQVLEVRYRGRNIRQVLDLTVREALTFFSSRRKCCDGCRCSTRSASATCVSASRRRPCRAAKRSASRSRRICRRTPASGCSTCWTNRRPACTSTTSPSCSPRSASCSTPDIPARHRAQS